MEGDLCILILSISFAKTRFTDIRLVDTQHYVPVYLCSNRMMTGFKYNIHMSLQQAILCFGSVSVTFIPYSKKIYVLDVFRLHLFHCSERFYVLEVFRLHLFITARRFMFWMCFGYIYFIAANDFMFWKCFGYIYSLQQEYLCFGCVSVTFHCEQEGIILGSRRSGAYLWNLAIYSVPKEFRPSVTLIIASNIPLGR